MLTVAIVLGLSLSSQTTAEEAVKETKSPVPVQVERRKPLQEKDFRKTELALTRYHNSVEIVRDRTKGGQYATFVTEPRLLDPGAVVVFEAYSQNQVGLIPRWRCVAVDDVAECLGAKMRIKYLPNDEKIVLRATLHAESELELTEALASR